MEKVYYRCMFHNQFHFTERDEDPLKKDTIACGSREEASELGWRFLNYFPICPACIADKRHKIKFLEAPLAQTLEGEYYDFWPGVVAKKKLAELEQRWTELCEAA